MDKTGFEREIGFGGFEHLAALRLVSWLTVALLFLFMLVNFADKAVIGIAAVPITDSEVLPRVADESEVAGARIAQNDQPLSRIVD